MRFLGFQFGESASIPAGIRKIVSRDHDVVAMGQEETETETVRYVWVVPNYKLSKWFRKDRDVWFRGPPPPVGKGDTRRRSRPKPDRPLLDPFLNAEE